MSRPAPPSRRGPLRTALLIAALLFAGAQARVGAPNSPSFEFEGPYGIRVLRGGTEIELSGTFSWAVPQNLENTLAQWPKVRVVHLDSPGGHVQPAFQVARIIQERRLDTYVARVCASACTLAFLAGERRWLGPNAIIGFHQAHAPGVAEGDRQGIALLEQAYNGYGLPESFIDHALRTEPTGLWVPTPAELKAANVVTDFAPDGTFALSGFGPDPDIAATERRLLTLPALAALAKIDPRWPKLLALWDRSVREGLPETEFRAAVLADLRAAYTRLLPLAPDAAVRGYARVLQRVLAMRPSVPADACWPLFDGAAAVGLPVVPTDVLVAHELALAHMLEEGSLAAAARATSQPRPPDAPSEVALPGRLGADCSALRDALSGAMARPDTAALRALLARLPSLAS
jgi:hypothetical protein